MCAGGCALHVAGFDVMFVCRRSVFNKSCSRGHQSVFVIATNRGERPGCAPRIQTRFHLQVRLHVRLIRFRGTFLLSHSARVFSTEHLFSLPIVRLRARLGYVTPHRLFCLIVQETCQRAQFSPDHPVFSFLVHVEHKDMPLQDQRPAATTNGKGYQGHEAA